MISFLLLLVISPMLYLSFYMFFFIIFFLLFFVLGVIYLIFKDMNYLEKKNNFYNNAFCFKKTFLVHIVVWITSR